MTTVVLAAAATAVFLGGGRQPACGCSPVPPVSLNAKPTAARFESLVRAGDAPGAWAMLTDPARARYGDVAGFRTVVPRLAARYAAGAGSDWAVLSPMQYGRPPAGAMVARLPAADLPQDPAEIARQAIMVVAPGTSDDWRADPEPAVREVRVRADGPEQIRVTQHPASDRHRLGMWVRDAAGEWLTHGWASTGPDSYTVHKPGAPATGPFLVVMTGSTDGLTWWVGATTTDAKT